MKYVSDVHNGSLHQQVTVYRAKFHMILTLSKVSSYIHFQSNRKSSYRCLIKFHKIVDGI